MSVCLTSMELGLSVNPSRLTPNILSTNIEEPHTRPDSQIFQTYTESESTMSSALDGKDRSIRASVTE